MLDCLTLLFGFIFGFLSFDNTGSFDKKIEGADGMGARVDYSFLLPLRRVGCECQSDIANWRLFFFCLQWSIGFFMLFCAILSLF